MLRFVACLCFVVGCSDAYRVSVRFENPDTRSAATQVEVAVVEGCQGADLSGPPQGAFRSTVFGVGESADALGELAPGNYGLRARAIDDSCTVIAAGCAPISVSAGEMGELSVLLSNVDDTSCAPSLCPGVCGGSDASVDALVRDAGTDAGADVFDGGFDAGFDGGPGCEAPGLMCGDTCVNPTVNVMHCGDCDVVCDGSDVCFDGACRQDVCTDALGVPCDEVYGSYFKASNPNTFDFFGAAVSVSGDTIAVGAEAEDSRASEVMGDQDDNNGCDVGAVYVFRRVDGVWTQEAYLKGSGNLEAGYFGTSLSLEANTLVVGTGNQNGAPGSAHVFQRTRTTWVEQARLEASNADPEDYFGQSVSLSGDLIAVGAPAESSATTTINGDETDNTARSAGAVYVFAREGENWIQQAYIKAPNANAGDAFGSAVQLDGNTLAIGAAGEDSAATGVDGDAADNTVEGSGAVYIFQLQVDGWVRQAYLKASTVDMNDRFGRSLALSGDTLAVSASGEDSGSAADQGDNTASESGAVYIFERAGGLWRQQQYLKPLVIDGGDVFGIALALQGDTLAVGASAEDSSANGVNGDARNNSSEGSGAVYLFRRTRSRWTQQAYIKPPSSAVGDGFGVRVALSGNMLVVGATGEDSAATGVDGDRLDNSAPSSGAAYSYRISP